MVARVVDEEERARAVDHVRNDQRSAERRAKSLLQVIGLMRRLAVQRERCGIENRCVDALEERAADLIAAAAAAERSAGAAAPARSRGRPRSRPAAPKPAARPVRRGHDALPPPPKPFANRCAKSPGPSGPKKPFVRLRSCRWRSRIQRRSPARTRAATTTARGGVERCPLRPASRAGFVGDEREALERPPARPRPRRAPAALTAAASPAARTADVRPGRRRRGAAAGDRRPARLRLSPTGPQPAPARAKRASSRDRRASDSSPDRPVTSRAPWRTRRTRPSRV